jgi:hypothetical protein
MADIDVRDTRAGAIIEHTGFRLSWGAIFAGLVIAIVLQIFLAMLGIAIGMTAWEPGDPARGLGTGAAVWAVVSALLSLFAGGVVTGRLAGVLTRNDGALHGVVMWGVSVIVLLWLTFSGVGMLMGGVFRAAASPVAAMVAEDQPVERAAREAVDTVQVIAEQVAPGAAEALGAAAWWAVVILALGAAASAAGAAVTARD